MKHINFPYTVESKICYSSHKELLRSFKKVSREIKEGGFDMEFEEERQH